MEIERYPVKLGSIHYERSEETGSQCAPQLDIRIFPLNIAEKEEKKTNYLGLELEFRVNYESFHISGMMEQVVKLTGKMVQSEEDLTEEELSVIIQPLLKEMEQVAQEVNEYTTERNRRRNG